MKDFKFIVKLYFARKNINRVKYFNKLLDFAGTNEFYDKENNLLERDWIKLLMGFSI